MSNLTVYEMNVMIDLLHQKLDSVTDHTPALLVTQYIMILSKLEQGKNDLMVQQINSIINETIK